MRNNTHTQLWLLLSMRNHTQQFMCCTVTLLAGHRTAALVARPRHCGAQESCVAETRCNMTVITDTPSHALKTFTFVCDQADHVAAMQAQLLPTSADLPATTTTAETVQTILGVKALLAQLVCQAHDAPGVLEALAALLEASNSQSGVQAHAEHAVQRLHFVHLAVKTLQEAVAQSAVCMDLFLCLHFPAIWWLCARRAARVWVLRCDGLVFTAHYPGGSGVRAMCHCACQHPMQCGAAGFVQAAHTATAYARLQPVSEHLFQYKGTRLLSGREPGIHAATAAVAARANLRARQRRGRLGRAVRGAVGGKPRSGGRAGAGQHHPQAASDRGAAGARHHSITQTIQHAHCKTHIRNGRVSCLLLAVQAMLLPAHPASCQSSNCPCRPRFILQDLRTKHAARALAKLPTHTAHCSYPLTCACRTPSRTS